MPCSTLLECLIWFTAFVNKIGSTRHTGGECTREAESNAGEHTEGLRWSGSGEQHDSGVQVIRR